MKETVKELPTSYTVIDYLLEAYDPVSADEQLRLQLLACNGCDESRERLVNSVIRMVVHTAHRHLSEQDGDEKLVDLVAAGINGVHKAVDSFNPERGAAFNTFAFVKASYAMLDETRKAEERWRHEEAVDIDNMSDPSQENQSRTTEDAALTNVLFSKIVEEIASNSTLTENEKRVLFWHITEGLSFKEIAQKRGKGTRQAAESVFKNAVEKIKSHNKTMELFRELNGD